MKNISNARQLRKNLTDAEQKLWRRLRGCQMGGCKFRRQMPIGNYIADFVCLEKRLIIEVDGGQHAIQEEYDAERTEWLQSQGFKVIRFWNHDVFQHIESIEETIMRNLFP